MEINLDNAFLVLLKLTLGFFAKYFDDMSRSVAKRCHTNILWLLRKPLLTTYLFTCTLLMVFGVFTLSMLLVATVACIVAIIVVFEALILGVVLVLAVSFAIISMGLFINIFTIKIAYTKKYYEE